MSETLCQICNAQPKKYKCPTCAIPYCSLPCFKQHKPTHGSSATTTTTSSTTKPSTTAPIQAPETAVLDVPKPPKYIKQTTDFSLLPRDPAFNQLLKNTPALLPALQSIYAATIEPDPESQSRQPASYGGRGSRGRGRGCRGDWGRGRGRGRGGRGGGKDGRIQKWNEKKGDADAMKMQKAYRDGKRSEEEKEAMALFVRFVEEKFDADGGGKEEADRMQIG